MILFGTGIEGEIFFYRQKGKIDFVIDNNRLSRFHGLNVYRLDEVGKERLKNNLIIVATSLSTYQVIKGILIANGLSEYKDFLYCGYYGRKLAIFYGNCHIGAIAEVLRKNPNFSEEYAIKYYYVDENNPELEYPTKEDIVYSELIVMHDIRTENKLKIPGVNEIKKYSKNAKVIVIPNLWGMNFLWPQVNEDRISFAKKLLMTHFNDYSMIEEESECEYFQSNIIMERKKMAVGLIEHKDEFVEKNIGLSTTVLADQIRNAEIFDKEAVVRNYNNAITKLRERERGCSITISDYIVANIKNKQLFYDEGHPHENIIIEKSRRILRLLDIPIEGEEYAELSLDSVELFVYGCVRRYLGITWEKKYIRCKNSKYTYDRHGITLEEYIDTYKTWRF